MLLLSLKDDKKKKSDLVTDLEESRLKASTLTSELKETKDKLSEMTLELKEQKDKEKALESEVRTFEAEIKYMDANKNNTNILSDQINSLEKLKDNLEGKLELKEKKIEELLLDKELLLKEKSEILESKNEILQQIKERELELQKGDQKLDVLKEKFKQSSGELLSKTMVIDKLVKKGKSFEDLENKINILEKDLEEKNIAEKEYEEKIEVLEKNGDIFQQKQKKEKKEISSENTEVLFDMESIIEKIREMFPQGKSNIRLVIPEIDDLNKFELIDTIKKIPKKIRINIGTKIEDPDSNALVSEIKGHCQLTNYFDKKFIALNIDSSKFLIGVFTKDDIVGIYTEIMEIIDLLKPTIMEPFIRGSKIT